MDDIRRVLGDENFHELLDSHLLPIGPNSPLWGDDFEGFLKWRQDAIWREIQTVTGVREAADIPADEAAV